MTICGCRKSEGFGGASIAIKFTGEFNGYASTTKTFRVPATANSPCPAGCTVTGSGDMFSYNVGPVLKYRGERWEPFVEVLFGGVHSNTYNNLFKACQANCTTTLTPSNNAFDFVVVQLAWQALKRLL